MAQLEFTRSESESVEDIRAMLEGHVFHVTKHAYWSAIEAAGSLHPNSTGELPTTFGSSSNSYFRKRGCVSLFDYRVPAPSEPDYRSKCDPFLPAEAGGDAIVFLFFDSSIHEHLVPWTAWKTESAWADNIVPYVESGYKGLLPLTAMCRTLIFRRTKNPNSVDAIYRRARGLE